MPLRRSGSRLRASHDRAGSGEPGFRICDAPLRAASRAGHGRWCPLIKQPLCQTATPNPSRGAERVRAVNPSLHSEGRGAPIGADDWWFSRLPCEVIAQRRCGAPTAAVLRSRGGSSGNEHLPTDFSAGRSPRPASEEWQSLVVGPGRSPRPSGIVRARHERGRRIQPGFASKLASPDH